jgi:toxin secretion/phage lysis holin
MRDDSLEIFFPYVEIVKMKAPVLIAVAWSSIASLFNTYIFDDWSFLVYLVILIVLDTILGIWKAFKYGIISSSKFGGLVIKSVLYAFFLVVVHNLTNFSNNEVTKSIFIWVEELCYAALLVREAISIIENIGAIKPDLLPSWILKRLKTFDEKGQFQIESE